MERVNVIALSVLVIIASLTNNTSTACVGTCYGKSVGKYQHCSDCQKYVVCSNGSKYNMPCPAKLVWDDRKKTCDYNSSTCSSATSANTTTSVRTTPIVQTPTVCVNSCSGKSDGNYQHCSDCQTYWFCSRGYNYNMSCPANLVWDDRKKKCDYISSTCTSSTRANTATSVRRTTPIVPTPTVCVDSCYGKSNGNYQHCSDCVKYVNCFNGFRFNLSCPANLVWDDRKKKCDFNSSTCSSATSAFVPTVCVNSCRALSNGTYQYCQDCGSYVYCNKEVKYMFSCKFNLVWDDRKKRCELVSSTCP